MSAFSDFGVPGLILCRPIDAYFDEDEIRKFTFLYSEKEPARKAERRLRKNYPEAEYLVMKGYGHCVFQMERPEEYAQLMSKEAFSKVERS